MIELFQVTYLMHNDIVREVKRQKKQAIMKIEIFFVGTTPPPAVHIFYGNGMIRKTIVGIKHIHPFANKFFCPRPAGAVALLRYMIRYFPTALFLKHILKRLNNPRLMIADRPLNMPLFCPHGRGHDHLAIPVDQNTKPFGLPVPFYAIQNMLLGHTREVLAKYSIKKDRGRKKEMVNNGNADADEALVVAVRHANADRDRGLQTVFVLQALANLHEAASPFPAAVPEEKE